MPQAAGLEAAARCDRALWQLVQAETQSNRELARGLARLWDERLFFPLGSARARDFIREHAGIPESRARWLARLGRQLNALPELDQALAERRISASHAIELGAVVNATTDPVERALWIERAQVTPVREFRQLVRAAREAKVKAPAEEQAPAADPKIELLDFREGAVDDDPDAIPDGGWISIPAPARVAVLWHGATDLARAAAGRKMSQGQSAEMIFAEYLSAIGPDETGPPPDREGERRAKLLADVMEAMNNSRPGSRSEGESEPAPPIAAATSLPAPQRNPAVDWQVSELPLPKGCVVTAEQNAWKMGKAIVRLCRLKQRLRYEIAAELAQMQEAGHWLALGFRSFAAYCEERLDFGLRRAERLIRFKHGLDRFPKLRDAYLGGRISYSVALLLLPILHPTTEEEWVRWADRRTFRELERVTTYASMYALPDADPRVLESWVRGLAEQGLASSTNGAEVTTSLTATTFTGEIQVPLGYALPPGAPRALPRISGIPSDIALAPPELPIARIRFWLPKDALDLAYRALQHARSSTANPLLPTWGALELVLVHFIQTHDTPLARKLARRHRIIARDDYQCLVPGCTSCANLNAHHLEHRAQGGSDADSNQATDCFCHHVPGQHGGVIDMGGYAPDHLITKLGINPRTGIAFAYYLNERRVSRKYAERELAKWRAELRVARRERVQKRAMPKRGAA
jgi:hypothetical protein